jgi:molybdopterin molybdotransferase
MSCSVDGLMSKDEALDLLLSKAVRTDRVKRVSLYDALDCVLAVDIKSNINVPEFDNSAMDGYAIANDGLNRFKVTQRIPAGSVGTRLEPGEAARIFTGAPIPEGTTTVMMQERCEEEAGSVEVFGIVEDGQNIRPKGNSIRKGEIVLEIGKKLTPADIALAASVGEKELVVFDRVIVGVFFTGDEIVEPGTALEPGQIYNTNQYGIVALLKQLGCDVVNGGVVEDGFYPTIKKLEYLREICDLIITTGGVSVGEEDHVKPAVESLGKLDLWKIKMKPGKPVAFGDIGVPFIGLPGNPVSAMVTFQLFAKPFIEKMQGRDTTINAIKVQAGFDWLRFKDRREFVRVRLDHTTIPPTANLFHKQGSDVLTSMVWADGITEIKESTTFKKGEIIDYFEMS